MRKNHPFTLTELLTALAVLAILVSMLLPALAKAREKARQVQCLNHLRQLAWAMQGYADDWHGRLAPYVTNAPRDAHPGLNWTAWTFPYHQNPGILVCPATTSGKPPETTPDGFRKYDGSYGWNYDGTQGNCGPLTAHVRQPTRSYLVMDSGDPCIIYGANHWDNLMEELDLDWDSGTEGCNRHLARVNVAFVDGHCSDRALLPFLAAPCKSWDPPWCMAWDNGELLPGTIPFPER